MRTRREDQMSGKLGPVSADKYVKDMRYCHKRGLSSRWRTPRYFAVLALSLVGLPQHSQGPKT